MDLFIPQRLIVERICSYTELAQMPVEWMMASYDMLSYQAAQGRDLEHERWLAQQRRSGG